VDRLLWLDMEMTGLDVEKEVPIEVAAIVADYDFNEYETYHAIIKQPQRYLENMDDWNKEHHGESGLTAAVATGQDPESVQDDLIMLIERHFHEPAILAGNSISQDRLFIDKYLPRLAERLHYRMLDVTSFKLVMNKKFQKTYHKKNSHRAVDDIRESMSELKYYLQYIKTETAE
jgi:oligoribonuclease